MRMEIAILLFAAFLFVAQAIPASKYSDDDIVNESEREQKYDVDLSKLTEEELKNIVQHFQENLRRAVDEMGPDHFELVEDENSLERRNKKKEFKIGKGWSLGSKGLSWENERKTMLFNIRPTFRGIKPDGFRARFTIRF